MKLVMHSYTFRGYPAEFAFKNARRFGWEAVELQPCHFNRDDFENELPRCIAAGKKYGVPIYCVDFGGSFIDDDPAVIERSVRQMELELDLCGKYGITMMNGSAGPLRVDDEDFGKNGSALATPVHYERAAEAFKTLAIRARTHRIRIALEVHMNTIHDTFAATNRLLDMIGEDNVVANPDPGNMFSTSTAEKGAGALELLRGRIGYFHLKNCVFHAGKYSYSVKLADGHIDTHKIIQKLIDMDYDGAICVEYCGEGDPHVAAEQDIVYLRKCLDWAIRP